jgi:hypothetical protein
MKTTRRQPCKARVVIQKVERAQWNPGVFYSVLVNGDEAGRYASHRAACACALLLVTHQNPQLRGARIFDATGEASPVPAIREKLQRALVTAIVDKCRHGEPLTEWEARRMAKIIGQLVEDVCPNITPTPNV